MGKLSFGNGQSGARVAVAKEVQIVEVPVEVHTKEIVEVPVEVKVETVKEVVVEKIVEKLDTNKLQAIEVKLGELVSDLNEIQDHIEEHNKQLDQEFKTVDILLESQEVQLDNALSMIEKLCEVDQKNQAKLESDIKQYELSMKNLESKIFMQNVLMSGSAIILLISLIIFIVNQ